jgi:protein-disulfide isomerase
LWTVDSRAEQPTQESAADPRRRQLLIGAAAVAVLAAGGAGYYFLKPSNSILTDPKAGGPKGGAPDTADLMKPPPLGDVSLGDPKAPITVIEYASMTCPHCAHFETTTFPELKKRYIDTGKVYYIFREFPLDELAAAGSMLARCSGKDNYFPLIETLFASQRDWVVQKPREPLLAIVKQTGMTEEAFDTCLANQQMVQAIEKTRSDASEKFGVQSTPTFFINGKLVSGDMPIEDMEKQFAPYLKES